MNRIVLVGCALGALSLSFAGDVAKGKHIAKANLLGRTGAPVSSATADPSGRIRFTNVPPGEYTVRITNEDGRTVSIGDVDGDGRADLVVGDTRATGTFSDGTPADATEGAQAAAGGGGGAGKVSMQDMHVMKRAPGAPQDASVTSPRDVATGQATGKRMHKPMVLLVDWSGPVQGGFRTEADARAAGERMPASPAGRCAVKVETPSPGTIEIQSWSWGVSNTGATAMK